MYDVKRFVMTEVIMETKDYAIEQLIKDLRGWSKHLYLVSESDGLIKYKGLIPIKELEDIRLLLAVSPYGNGYKVIVEGYDIYDLRLKRIIGLAI